MRGLAIGTLALALFAPSVALAAPCAASPDLAGAVETAREQIDEDPAAVAASLSGIVQGLTCLSEPPEPSDLAALWQLLGVAWTRTGKAAEGKRALVQAGAMPVDEMVVTVNDIDVLEPYINAYQRDWELGRLNVGPVNVDAAIYIDGIRQARAFAPVKAPAKHLVQVFEGEALVFSALVDAPVGDLDVSTEVDPATERARAKAAKLAEKLAAKQAKAQAKADARQAKADAKRAKNEAKQLAKAGEPDPSVGPEPDPTPTDDAPAVTDAGDPDPAAQPEPDVSKEKPPKPPKAPSQGGAGKTVRAISLGAGGVALGLGAGALYFNQQTSTFLNQGDGYSAARAFDNSRILGISAGGLGAASLLGLGLSFTMSGRF